MITVYPNSNNFIYQWDYGQTIQLKGFALPESYEVHFATSENGDSISVTGNASGVQIPDELLEEGNDIFGWVFVKTEESGTTKYRFTLKIKKRAKPSEPRPEIEPAEGVEF